MKKNKGRKGKSHKRNQCLLVLDNKLSMNGLYQKAEALYTMGDFEFALVLYHRGHKLRPQLQEFRLGIQKAEEASNNSVGDLIKGKTRTGERLQDVIVSCISYLDARTEFWQQQKPIYGLTYLETYLLYARERDRKLLHKKESHKDPPSF